MLEKPIERALCDRAKTQGIAAYKFKSPAHAAVPDRLVLAPIPEWLRMKTDKAARIMVSGILAGKREVIVTFHGRVLVFFARHLPRFTRWLLMRNADRSRPEPGG